MKHAHLASRFACAIFALVLGIAAQAKPVNPAPVFDHPYYLHALSDLRAARWMIEHRPGNWIQTDDEIAAVKQIDAAISEIKKASIDDGKDIAYHPHVDEHPDHGGRLHDALDFLRKSRQDISHDEDNAFAQGLQMRAYDHIDHAISAVKHAIDANHW